jgi:hypothetical protein
MGKLIIMANASENQARERELSSFGPSGPISADEIRILRQLDKIEATNKIHEERLHQLTRQADATTALLPALQNTIAQHTNDLNGLGRVAHSAKLFGNIALVLIGSGVAVMLAIFTAIFTFLSHHLVFK